MSVFLVTSADAGAGKTTLACALALHSFGLGLRTGVLRLAGDDGAPADAAFYAGLPFAAPPSGQPVTAAEAADRVSRYEPGLLLIEAALPDAAELAARLGAGIIISGCGADALANIERALGSTGGAARAIAATAVPERDLPAVREALAALTLPALFVLPEDRTLHAPSIAQVAGATGAQVLLGEASEEAIAENILIAPVAADPAYLHFQRYPNKLVIARSEKTELQIAAATTSTSAMLLTGGIMPGVYTFDRLGNEGIPLLLAPGETIEVIESMGDLHASARFHSRRKLERLEELLRGALDVSPLGLEAAATA